MEKRSRDTEWVGMIESTVNWDAVGAIGTVIGIPLAAVGLYLSIRKNRTALGQINTRVTTPNTVHGTLAETVADISVDNKEHYATDDARIARLWQELGKEEPK